MEDGTRGCRPSLTHLPLTLDAFDAFGAAALAGRAATACGRRIGPLVCDSALAYSVEAAMTSKRGSLYELVCGLTCEAVLAAMCLRRDFLYSKFSNGRRRERRPST